MKKVGIGILLIFSSALAVQAQTSRQLSEEQKKELKAKMETYKAELRLTEEQQAKFEEINLQFAQELSTLKDDNGRRMSKYKKFKKITDERNSSMKALLTPDQYKIFKAHQDEVKKDLKSRRANR
jgi:flagellar biosynthesis component FlhA